MTLIITDNNAGYGKALLVSVTGLGLPKPVEVFFEAVSRDDVKCYFEDEESEEIQEYRVQYLPGNVYMRNVILTDIMTILNYHVDWISEVNKDDIAAYITKCATKAEATYGCNVSDFEEFGCDARITFS